MARDSTTVRRAGPDDAATAARLLHEFNLEFDSPTPGVRALTDRLTELLQSGDVALLLAGHGPDGIAVLRFRPALWREGLDAYLEELYVVPSLRGGGIGRALLDAVLGAL